MNATPTPLDPRRTRVFGPAYLDRVLRVDGPLVDRALRGPLDESVDGRLLPGVGEGGLELVDPSGARLAVELPADWPGPRGGVELSRTLIPGSSGRPSRVRGVAWEDDLGGMGAGFASAFRAELISALGQEDDDVSRAVAERLERQGIRHRPIRVAGRPADWTLLVTSGPFGDKLPIGFRGCHAALSAEGLGAIASAQTDDLRVVAALPNRLAAAVLLAPGAAVRFFAPAARNMADREVPVAGFAGSIDVLSCNRGEWESLDDREVVDHVVPVVAITDGEAGSRVRFQRADGGRGELVLPAFPRRHPPRDTNRAGEAYAATLVATLLDAGWTPGPAPDDLVRRAAERASAAAALVLDLTAFGFPGAADLDAALRAGCVG